MNNTPDCTLRDATAEDLPALQALLGHAPAWPLPAGQRRLLACDATGRPVATLRLCPDTGTAAPRYWYHVGCAVHAAAELQLFRRQPTLLLGNDLTGATELLELAMAVDAGAAMTALVRHAIAAAADTATDTAPDTVKPGPTTVFAELPGPLDGSGASPFWAGLGRHFYTGDPRAAEARHGDAWRSHVAALLPRQLVYTSFLPDDAQAVIGTAAPGALALRAALERAGLQYRQHVRIDDAGPVLECSRVPGAAG